MIKSVQYAYASSPMARHFGREGEGCYYVAVNESKVWPGNRRVYGPYATRELARLKAESLPFPYGHSVRRAAA